MIPSAEAVLASLLLRSEALGGPCNKTIYAVGSEEVRALIVIEISSFLSNLATQDCESETSTDFYSNNVQGLNDLRLQNSIEPVIERFLNSPNSCGAPLPLDSSLSVFLGHFGFRDGAQQMYTLPIDPSLVALVRTNFPHLTENECSTHIHQHLYCHVESLPSSCNMASNSVPHPPSSHDILSRWKTQDHPCWEKGDSPSDIGHSSSPPVSRCKSNFKVCHALCALCFRF